MKTKTIVRSALGITLKERILHVIPNALLWFVLYCTLVMFPLWLVGGYAVIIEQNKFGYVIAGAAIGWYLPLGLLWDLLFFKPITNSIWWICIDSKIRDYRIIMRYAVRMPKTHSIESQFVYVNGLLIGLAASERYCSNNADGAAGLVFRDQFIALHSALSHTIWKINSNWNYYRGNRK